MLFFCDFIEEFVIITNHHLKDAKALPTEFLLFKQSLINLNSATGWY